ncbi:MAG: 2-phosphosulfolactate phosphatase [Eubacteriales bacterium]|nr:2-phosphosulfolactate phosphatase [Eubacteriales bacterium]
MTVFRAFSLECYLFDMGAAEIRPIGSVEDALAWGEKDPGCVLIGERGGAKVEGFEFGNSPSTVDPDRIKGSRIIHTTSAGTQGVVNAVHADEIITGSLVNAATIAEYIKQVNPAKVSLVCMGQAGVAPAREDEVCAEYIKAMLVGEDLSAFDEIIKSLQCDGGDHFFTTDRQHIYPEKDFWMCIEKDKFDFVIRIEKDGMGFVSRRL